MNGVMTQDVECVLAGALGGTVESLERQPYGYRTSHAIETLDVRLAGGSTLRLLFKNLSAASDLTDFATPAFVSDPSREIDVYREILATRALDTPRYYGALADPAEGRYWLFIEDIAGIVLWQSGELAVWQEAARWLARFHVDCATVSHPRLLRYDRPLYGTWLERALANNTGSPLERLAAGYGSVIDRLLELPTTFIHGEFYASNVLVELGAGAVRIRPIDWGMAATGPALLDLAALTAGEWSAAERRAIESAYNDALPAPYAPEALLEGLECARLHIALQWLGWGSTWSPPSEHARDWLAEALRAAEGLGIVSGDAG